jgi:hypothetical protein
MDTVLHLVLTALQLLSLTPHLHTYQHIHGQVPALAPNTPIPQPQLPALDVALHLVLPVMPLLSLTPHLPS